MGTLKVDNLQKRDGTALITDGAASTTLLSQASLRSAGVGLIKINTQTVSGASTVNFTDLDTTSGSSLYSSFKIVMDNVTADSDNAALFYAIQPDAEVVIKTIYGDIKSAKKRTIKRWMKSEVFKSMVKDERIKLLKDNEFGEEDVITMLKKAISMAEDKKDVSNYMRCVENIQDMLGMRDKDKVVETTQIEATTSRKLRDEIAEEEKKLIATNQKVTDE